MLLHRQMLLVLWLAVRKKAANTFYLNCSAIPSRALKYHDSYIRADYFSQELIEEQLKAATVFKINDDELELLRPMFNVEGSDEEACAWFIKNYDL